MITRIGRYLSKDVISVTPAACHRIKELMEGKEDILGIKIGVKKRGCNGLSYTMNYAEEVKKLDEVVEVDDFKVVIDAPAVMYLLGTEMDYVINPLAEEFVFTNPNAKGQCGCGESFNVA